MQRNTRPLVEDLRDVEMEIAEVQMGHPLPGSVYTQTTARNRGCKGDAPRTHPQPVVPLAADLDAGNARPRCY